MLDTAAALRRNTDDKGFERAQNECEPLERSQEAIDEGRIRSVSVRIVSDALNDGS